MNNPCLFAMLACISSHAQALGQLADVNIVDQETGMNLPVHHYRGNSWVAGTPGHRYAVVISSHSGQRLLAVTSVDGINVVTGEGAGFDQRGYVFEPWQSYSIGGWRKSDAEVASFVFSAAPESYAARTGRPANIGVIGLALFRERAPQPLWPLQVEPDAAAERANDAAAAAPPAPAKSAAAGEAQRRPTAPLGTGHGERQYSAVSHTTFERATQRPEEIIRIRYDSYEHLVAMGVIHQPYRQANAPEAFPAARDTHYVPDPPGG